MSRGSKPHSPLHHTVREERKVQRYSIDGARFSERTRLALSLVAHEFRTERPTRGYVPGDFARALGDGNGWNAVPTIRQLVRLGWVTEGVGGAAWQRAYRWTDDGMRALVELDRQHRTRERCPVCLGYGPVRKVNDIRLPVDPCACEGTLLVRRWKGEA